MAKGIANAADCANEACHVPHDLGIEAERGKLNLSRRRGWEADWFRLLSQIFLL